MLKSHAQKQVILVKYTQKHYEDVLSRPSVRPLKKYPLDGDNRCIDSCYVYLKI